MENTISAAHVEKETTMVHEVCSHKGDIADSARDQ